MQVKDEPLLAFFLACLSAACSQQPLVREGQTDGRRAGHGRGVVGPRAAGPWSFVCLTVRLAAWLAWLCCFVLCVFSNPLIYQSITPSSQSKCNSGGFPVFPLNMGGGVLVSREDCTTDAVAAAPGNAVLETGLVYQREFAGLLVQVPCKAGSLPFRSALRARAGAVRVNFGFDGGDMSLCGTAALERWGGGEVQFLHGTFAWLLGTFINTQQMCSDL